MSSDGLRTLMSLRRHVFCLHTASTHLKSAKTGARHASMVPPHVNCHEHVTHEVMREQLVGVMSVELS